MQVMAALDFNGSTDHSMLVVVVEVHEKLQQQEQVAQAVAAMVEELAEMAF
jgi:hypothetical protein